MQSSFITLPYITASLHTEHVNTTERMEEFANKLIHARNMMSQLRSIWLWFPNGLNETGGMSYTPAQRH